MSKEPEKENTIKTYIVKVKVTSTELYRIDAETPEAARNNYHDGCLLTCDHLETEVVGVRERTDQPLNNYQPTSQGRPEM